MELCPGGNLSDLVWNRRQAKKPLTPEEVLSIFVQVRSELDWCYMGVHDLLVRRYVTLSTRCTRSLRL
jgi:serine/threonine protein kinase